MVADTGMRPRDLLNLPAEERAFLFAARSEQNRRRDRNAKTSGGNP